MREIRDGRRESEKREIGGDEIEMRARVVQPVAPLSLRKEKGEMRARGGRERDGRRVMRERERM